jgi:hypothetical protein
MKNKLYLSQVCERLIVKSSIDSSLGNFLLKVVALLAKSKSVVYITTSCDNFAVSLARSRAKNNIPPNCVAGSDAGQTKPIFIIIEFFIKLFNIHSVFIRY